MQSSVLKKDYFEAIYKTKALMIKKEPFVLKSGGTSHIYLNHRDFLSNSKYLELIAKIYLDLIEKNAGACKLCSVDSAMSPVIVGAMSAISGRDIVVFRKDKKEHGTRENLHGDLSGEIVLVDDMTSTAGTLIEAAKCIRANGGTVRYAVVSACRDSAAKENAEKEGIELLFIASFREILEYLDEVLTKEEKNILKEECGD